MLIPDNIHPNNTIYYNGAFVLKVLQEKKRIDIFDLFIETKKLKNISFSVYVLCLDWLYLADIAEINEGSVILCS